MSSLNLFCTPALVTTRGRRVQTAATATKSSGGGGEEKSLWDFVLGALQKQEQLYEKDPILKKVEEKTSTTGTTGKKNSVVVPPKKKDGPFFGGLFAKKD
ncbi:hypothetical protein LguiA_020880 [Lonicera macranthoides]